MDDELIERIKADMRYEFERTAPPDGFPGIPRDLDRPPHERPVPRNSNRSTCGRRRG